MSKLKVLGGNFLKGTYEYHKDSLYLKNLQGEKETITNKDVKTINLESEYIKKLQNNNTKKIYWEVSLTFLISFFIGKGITLQIHSYEKTILKVFLIYLFVSLIVGLIIHTIMWLFKKHNGYLMEVVLKDNREIIISLKNEEEFKKVLTDFKVDFHETITRNETTFYSISKENKWNELRLLIINEYKDYGYDLIKIDRENCLLIKSNNKKLMGYCQLTINSDDSYKFEIFKVNEPKFINELNLKKTVEIKEQKDIFNNNSNSSKNLDKLIELSNLFEKGHLTKEEFEKLKKEFI